MQSIYLIGFMGSGKTTIGTELARHLDWQFVDTDQAVEEQYGQSITDIFATDGETVFRNYETHVLKQMPLDDAVVATGGGIVEREENRQWLQKYGYVIFLDAKLAEIRKRLVHDQTRPLWKKNQNDVELLYERRYNLYLNTADQVVETNGKHVHDIVNEVIRGINDQVSGQNKNKKE
ncbi:MAG: shikimate kinase [Bacillaceae bacterium]|nr:shikimate kinase [Bacillaceae bacterium]